VWECDNTEGMEVSRLSGEKSIVDQHSMASLNFNALLNRKPMKTLKNAR